MKCVTLNNGVKMPILGYGVYRRRRMRRSAACGRPSKWLPQHRHRPGLRQRGGRGEGGGKFRPLREEFFITTKVWISNAGYERAKVSIDES